MTDAFQTFLDNVQIKIEDQIQSVGLGDTAKLLAIQYCNQDKVDEKEIHTHRETIESHLEREYEEE